MIKVTSDGPRYLHMDGFDPQTFSVNRFYIQEDSYVDAFVSHFIFEF